MSKWLAGWGVLLSCMAASILGVAAVVLAVYGDPALQHYDSPLFPEVRRGIEGMNGASLVLLGLAGFIPAAFGRAHPLLVGIATMALFPVVSFAEMLADPRSHNLWPIEWFLYGVETAPGILGAFLGRHFKRTVWDPGSAGPADGKAPESGAAQQPDAPDERALGSTPPARR